MFTLFQRLRSSAHFVVLYPVLLTVSISYSIHWLLLDSQDTYVTHVPPSTRLEMLYCTVENMEVSVPLCKIEESLTALSFATPMSITYNVKFCPRYH